MNNCCKIGCELVKKYDPKPKNADGSIKWFLYRWDDGKNGYRKLVRCKECGSFYLIQCYKLNKFSGRIFLQARSLFCSSCSFELPPLAF